MKTTAVQYAKTLYELTAGRPPAEIGGVVKKLAALLGKKRQTNLLEKISANFNRIWNEKHGIVEAEVVSREMLSDELRNKVSSYVRNRYKAKEVVIQNTIDRNIKGGIIIRVGDEILDGSVSGRLEKLKAVLTR